MHCSIWRFKGDPADLERRYLALIAEVPEENHGFHAAARTADGLLIFDTCPSEQAFRDFFGSVSVQELFRRHGLPLGDHEDHPVVRAYARGVRVDGG